MLLKGKLCLRDVKDIGDNCLPMESEIFFKLMLYPDVNCYIKKHGIIYSKLGRLRPFVGKIQVKYASGASERQRLRDSERAREREKERESNIEKENEGERNKE